VTGICQLVGIWAVYWDNSVAASRMGDDAERPANLIGELGDAAEFGIALDLNTDQDKIARGEAGSGTTLVYPVAVGLTAISNNEGDNLASKIDVRRRVLDVFEDGSARIR
jgi:hypothetical protein